MVCSVNPVVTGVGDRSVGVGDGAMLVSGTGVGGARAVTGCVACGGGGEVGGAGHGSPAGGGDGRMPVVSWACSVFLLHPAMSNTPSRTTWMARMANTVMRRWDLPLSGKVPWGTSGFGVFIFKSGATERPFLRFYSVHVFRSGVLPQKNPKRRHIKSTGPCPRLLSGRPGPTRRFSAGFRLPGETLRPGAGSFETGQSWSKRVKAKLRRQLPRCARLPRLLLTTSRRGRKE